MQSDRGEMIVMAANRTPSAGDLRVFEAVARLGSMSRAAEELRMVQSNVTGRIRTLESDLGVPLFERHSRGVTLTQPGARLRPYAERLMVTLSDAARAVLDEGQPQGALVIGSLETTAAMRLPPIIAQYGIDYPEVDLVLRSGTTRELINLTLNRQVDGAVVCGPVNHPELVEQPLFSERLVLMTSASIDSLDRLENVNELKAIVLKLGCSYRQRLEDILARRGVVNVRWLEFGTLEAIVACVSAGVGVTLLPARLGEHVYRNRAIVMHELPKFESQVETVFVHRGDAYISSALQAFKDLASGRVPALDADAAIA